MLTKIMSRRRRHVTTHAIVKITMSSIAEAKLMPITASSKPASERLKLKENTKLAELSMTDLVIRGNSNM